MMNNLPWPAAPLTQAKSSGKKGIPAFFPGCAFIESFSPRFHPSPPFAKQKRQQFKLPFSFQTIYDCNLDIPASMRWRPWSAQRRPTGHLKWASSPYSSARLVPQTSFQVARYVWRPGRSQSAVYQVWRDAIKGILRTQRGMGGLHIESRRISPPQKGVSRPIPLTIILSQIFNTKVCSWYVSD
jgi:hypothetical protein